MLGVSCAGKSYILKIIKNYLPEIVCIDIDEIKYWREIPPKEIRTKFYDWFEEWSKNNADCHAEIIDNINLSNEQTKYTKMVILRACFNREPFISTCGNLPGLSSEFFPLLFKSFNGKIVHVLVSPNKNALVERIKMRGKKRIDMMDDLILVNERLKKRMENITILYLMITILTS